MIRAAVAGLRLVALLVAGVSPAIALPTTDEPAALLVFPYIAVDTAQGVDTTVQVANVSDVPVRVRCFLENSTSHCQPSGQYCESTATCPIAELCEPGWSVDEFSFVLTAGQPLGWNFSSGRSDLPLAANEGSIPAVPEPRFVGALRCLAVDAGGAPRDDNFLIGRATIETSSAAAVVDMASYNAVGFSAGQVDADGDLVLGDGGEFSGSAAVTILPFLYDGVSDPLFGDGNHETTLVAVPVSVDYATPASTSLVAQVLVFNELEERFSSSFSMGAQFVKRLNRIDTPNPSMSVLGVAVGGTVSGQMRVAPVGASGVVLLAVERRRDGEGTLASLIRQPSSSGVRATPDHVKLPVPATPTPTVTPTTTVTQTPTSSRTPSPTSTVTVTAAAEPTQSATNTGAPASPTPTVPPSPSVEPSATATIAPTQTSTPASTATPSPTLTLTETVSPTLTSAAEPSITPTQTPATCLGDCDGSGAVTVDELLKMVGIALGLQDISFCRNGDRDDGAVTVDEVVTAVQRALIGCPA